MSNSWRAHMSVIKSVYSGDREVPIAAHDQTVAVRVVLTAAEAAGVVRRQDSAVRLWGMVLPTPAC